MINSFNTDPPIGTRILLDEQAYELVGSEPYTRKSDGAPSRLLKWETLCPEAGCGECFRVTTGLAIEHLPRRCDRHKRIGAPVRGGRRRKIRIRVELP